jgi:hypothetical protein
VAVHRLRACSDHTHVMVDFSMNKPSFWIMTFFAVVGIVGCEAVAAWHEDSLHLHTPEYVASSPNNVTYGATGAFTTDGGSPLWL